MMPQHVVVSDDQEWGTLVLELVIPFRLDGGKAAGVIDDAREALLRDLEKLKDDEQLMAAISRLRGGYER